MNNKHKKYRLCIIFLLLNTGCTFQPLMSNSGYPINQSNKIKSWKDLNEQHIVMQEYDYSCGIASLATLLRYYFKQDITEKTLLDEIEEMFSVSEIQVIKNKGISFLELEKIARRKGYQTASVRLHLTSLKKLSGPVLVYIEPNNYKHFAVLRGIIGDRVFLADPSRGNIRMSVHEFSKEWRGETLILGKLGFGLPKYHTLSVHHTNSFRSELSVLREIIRIP